MRKEGERLREAHGIQVLSQHVVVRFLFSEVGMVQGRLKVRNV